MKTLLTKAAIIAAPDIQTKDIDVPEWGGMVRLKGLTGTERDEFEDGLFVDVVVNGKTERKQDTKNIRAKVVAAALVDENGVQMFGQDEIAELGKKSAAALQRCFDAAQALNGQGAKAEAAIKNDSPSVPSGASTSGSPAN
jgi:hypothetical protein